MTPCKDGICRALPGTIHEEGCPKVTPILTPGPWPLSFSEERMLRGFAFIIAGAMVHGRGSEWSAKEAEEEIRRLAPLLADLARAAIEGPIPER